MENCVIKLERQALKIVDTHHTIFHLNIAINREINNLTKGVYTLLTVSTVQFITYATCDFFTTMKKINFVINSKNISLPSFH